LLGASGSDPRTHHGSASDKIGGGVDSQLLTLIDLQAFDARIAALEAEAARVEETAPRSSGASAAASDR